MRRSSAKVFADFAVQSRGSKFWLKVFTICGVYGNVLRFLSSYIRAAQVVTKLPKFWKCLIVARIFQLIINTVAATFDAMSYPVVVVVYSLISMHVALCWWAISLSITVPELWGEMCTDRLFSQGVDLFALKFYFDRVVSNQPIWASKTRDTMGYPMAKTASFCVFFVLTQYRSVMDGQTDRRTDGFAV